MKYKIIIALMFLASVIDPLNAQANFFSNLAKAFGVKENSVVGQLARTADDIGNAVVSKKANDTMNKYGSEQITSYNNWANQYNENQDRKVQKYLSEVDQYKMDYCKSHGFYDLWYSKYGDDWFEREGRSWFDAQDASTERRTGERLLPWHLRDADGVRERANKSKVDGSLTNVVLGAFALSDADASRAENWTKSDKYGKRDIVIDKAFDIIGATTDNKDLINAFRKITKANNQYLKNKENPETSNVAMSNMVLDLSNIVFDAYETGVENRKAYLTEKLQIRNKLMEMGQDPSLANEVAGTILSIQNSKDLTEHEKKEWLRLLGFYGDEDNVIEISQSISQMTENQAKNLINDEDAKKVREKAENEKREREEKLRKERERNEAVSLINGIVIDSYIINESILNDVQKETLVGLVEILNKQDDISVEIIGNTCDLGSESVNEKIGMKRAERVKDYLIDSGVAEVRLSVSTDGEKEPAYENNSGQNRMKNRRVKFIAK